MKSSYKLLNYLMFVQTLIGDLAGEMELPEEFGDMTDMAGDVGGALTMGRKGFGSSGN